MFKEFIEFSYKLNDEGISSYSDLEKFKNSGLLSQRVSNEIDLESFVSKMQSYLSFLFFENSIPHYKKQLILHKEYDLTFLNLSEYLMCLFCDNLLAYRNFPLLLKSIVDKFKIEPFTNFSSEDFKMIIYKYYNVKESYSLNYNHIFHELNLPYTMNKTLYDEYEKDGYSEETSFVWAEVSAYESLLNDNFEYVDFVSRDYGDGYGYDILSINSFTNKEILIEVKSGRNESFTLTEHEHSVMLESSFNGADYVIFKYYIDSKNTFVVHKLIFNSDNYSFIDLETREEYSIEGTELEDNKKCFMVSKNEKVLEKVIN